MNDAAVPIGVAKRRLAVIWLSGFGFLLCLLMAQSVRGVYGPKVEQAWAWLLPCVMPTLSLIVGVIVSDAQKPGPADKQVDRFIVRLAVAFSVAYLFVVSATILLQPFSSLTPLGLMTQSHLWLAPLQGLNTAVLGALFVRQDPKDGDAKGPPRAV
jgi:hypothetical protein